MFFCCLTSVVYVCRQRTLRACWTYDPEQRSAIEHIIDQLKQKPNLIQPCLDAPRSAINPPDDFEEHMPDIQRSKRTLSEHSHLKNLDSQQPPLPSSPTANSIASDPFSHEFASLTPPCDVVIVSKNSSDKLSSMLKDTVNHRVPSYTPIMTNNHRHSRPYVIRSPNSGSGGVGENHQPPLPPVSPVHVGNCRNSMRTISNPMDSLMTNPDFIQFIANAPEPRIQNGGPLCKMSNGGRIALQRLESREEGEGLEKELLWHQESKA